MSRTKERTKLLLASLHAGFLALAAQFARADHGPGTSGGGASAQSGETLKPGKFSIEFREDYTEFDQLSPLNLVETGRQALLITFVAHDQTPFQITHEHRIGHGVYQRVLECELVIEVFLGVPTLLDQCCEPTVPKQ